MDCHDILAALRRKGSGVYKVAKTLGMTPGHISNVINGRHTSKKVARHIAKVSGIPVSVLWPDKYRDEHAMKRAA